MAKLLYVPEHLSCANYEEAETPFIQNFHYSPNQKWERSSLAKEIIFVLKGSFEISYDYYLNETISKGNMLLLAPGTLFKGSTEKGVTFIVMRLSKAVDFCDQYHLEDLSKRKGDKNKKEFPVLEIKPILQSFLSFITETYSDGLRCKHYIEIKSKELFFLFRGYYTKEELVTFFRPLISTDAQFAEFILANYHKVKSVAEFAELHSSSTSSFDRKFRKAFGMPAYQWMMSRRNERVFHEINSTNKPFLLIAKEQGFLSHSQFTDYCKKHLGGSPRELRKSKLSEAPEEV